MNRPRYIYAVVGIAAVVAAAVWAKYSDSVPTTTLSLRIGETYDDVIKGSTYPVVRNSVPPDDKPYYGGSTWISKPAVVIVFNDPEHGFTLPPTKFAGIGYEDRRVVTITTSPMLDPLPFDEGIALLNRLQADFKKASWQPTNTSADGPPDWFDTRSPAGIKELRVGGSRELSATKTLRMYLNFDCWEECRPEPSAKSVYLIDVSMGEPLVQETKQQWIAIGSGVPQSAAAIYAVVVFIAAAVWAKRHRRVHAAIAFVSHLAAPSPPPAPPPVCVIIYTA